MAPKKRKSTRTSTAQDSKEADEKKRAREEAKAKKDAEKAAKQAKRKAEKLRKEAEAEAAEELALRERAKRVVSLLQSIEKDEIKEEEAEILYNKSNGKFSSHAAPRALLNAVECCDLKRAKEIIKSFRFVVNAHGERVTDPTQIEKMEQDNSGGLTTLGLEWNVPFACPTCKSDKGADVNALSIALRNGQIEMVNLLIKYFGWKPLLGKESVESTTTTYRGHKFTASEGSLHALVTDTPNLPVQSFEKLLTNNKFIQHLPYATVRAMRFGRISFVRRALRYFLGLDYKNLENNKVTSKTQVTGGGDTMDVTLLHLLALEATSVEDIKGIKLNETSTNAAALDNFVTPMHLAALSGNLDIYKELEQAGGDWTIETDDGLKCISYAAAGPSSGIPVPIKEEEEVEEPKPKRRKTTKAKQKEEERKTKIKQEKKEKKEEDPVDVFQRVVQPSGTLHYMTQREDLTEELQREFDYQIGSRRIILEAAIAANRHHNVAWLIHWFDEKDSSQWYPHNGELSILQKVIASSSDAIMLGLFLAQPKFQSTFRSEGTDLLASVIGKSHVDMLKVILDEWKDMEDKDKVTLECTPVHLQTAIRNESLHMVRALLTLGKVDVNSPEVPKSALHLACEMDFVECAELLIQEGADPRAETSDDGVSVMQHSCRAASLSAIQLLMKHGISLDLKKEREIKKQKEEEEKAKKAKENEGKEDEAQDMETEEVSPFEGWFMVLTGVFSVSKEVIKRVIESQGGKVQPQVNGKTTHCVYSGRDGINDYGMRMGKGDKKYTAAKKKKLPFLNENDILRYLKRTGQAIASHETSGNLSTGPQQRHDEASFLHDVIKNCSNNNEVPSIQVLLDRGADKMIVDDFGRTPLHYAIIYLSQSDSNVKLLDALQDDEKKILVNQYDKTGFTPLLHACTSGKWKFVEALLPCVEDVNIYVKEPEEEEEKKKEEDKDKKDETKEDDKDKKEETKEEESAPVAPKFQNSYTGWSLAHLLLVNRRVDLFEKFLELGGDVNTCMRTPDLTPLVVTSVLEPDICRTLVTNPKCNVNATNSKGQTILHAIFMNLSIGRVLSAGERGGYTRQGLVTPHTQQISPPSGEISIIHVTNIWRWNPNIDGTTLDQDGTSVFHAACASEDTTSCIRTFLAKKCDLHKPNGIGNTPLAIALLNHKLHVVLFLLDQGADINGHVYWLRKKQEDDEAQTPNLYSTFYRRQQHHYHQNVLRDEDGEAVDDTRMRMSIYYYVMKSNMSADIIYNILRLPTCDMSEALRASISTGNLEWTEQLIRSVDVRTPEDAGKFVRLLFSSTVNPSREKQQKMMELSRRLVSAAGGVELDTKESTGYNVVHTMVGEYKIDNDIIGDMLKLLGHEKSIQALLETEKENGQNPLHMAVLGNKLPITKMILSFVKDHGTTEDISRLLNTKDSHSKTPLHYVVGANSEGTYLDGALLSLLVRFGAEITIPDGDGITVATFIGQMPQSQLDHFRLALVGRVDEDNAAAETVELSKEAVEQIDAAQAKREAEIEELAKKEKKKSKEYVEKWETLQEKWEEFRVTRLGAKSLIYEETRQKAREGRLLIPLDRSCPDSHAYEVHVSKDGDVYDALLVASDLRSNIFGSNSFHTVQIVRLTEAYKKKRVGQAKALANAQRNEAILAYRLGMAKYRVVERWGRIGDWDTKSRSPGFTELTKAVKHFEKVFLDKTKNEFAEREHFEAARGAYNWVQKEYDEAAKEDDNAENDMELDDELPKSVQTFFRAITSLTRVRQELRESGFGVDDLPLGQLSPNTISDAHKILNDIEALLFELEDIDQLRGRALRESRQEKYKIQSKLTDLSNKFYMTIPHDFGNINSGFKMPEVINRRDLLEKCLQMLLSLEDVENSINLLLSVSPKAGVRQRLNDIHRLVGCDFRVVSPETDEFKLVQQYASAGAQGKSCRIAHLLEVTRYEDAIRFSEHAEADRGLNNRFGQPKNQLLWHGSKMSNILGILMKGLKIAPPEAPVAGYNFGKGIYLADVFAKSASYSSSRHGYGYHNRKSATADVDHYRVMLLCEAALGEPCQLRNTNSDLTEPPEGFDSVQCVGRVAPSPEGMFLRKDGVGVPFGEVRNVKGGTMGYNEFIVYDESRVKIKYVMLFE